MIGRKEPSAYEVLNEALYRLGVGLCYCVDESSEILARYGISPDETDIERVVELSPSGEHLFYDSEGNYRGAGSGGEAPLFVPEGSWPPGDDPGGPSARRLLERPPAVLSLAHRLAACHGARSGAKSARVDAAS